jgi:hypothetical protein
MPISNMGLFVPLTASDGIHDNDVTDVSTCMATSSGLVSLVARYENRPPRTRVPAGATSGWKHSPARASASCAGRDSGGTLIPA